MCTHTRMNRRSLGSDHIISPPVVRWEEPEPGLAELLRKLQPCKGKLSLATGSHHEAFLVLRYSVCTERDLMT